MKLVNSCLTALLLAGAIPALSVRAAEPANKPAASAKEAKAKPYPLEYCLVSDEKFAGSDMKPFEMVNDGQTIKFCCKNCVKDFNKDKAKYLTKLATAVKQQEAKKQAEKK